MKILKIIIFVFCISYSSLNITGEIYGKIGSPQSRIALLQGRRFACFAARENTLDKEAYDLLTEETVLIEGIISLEKMRVQHVLDRSRTQDKRMFDALSKAIGTTEAILEDLYIKLR